jgi:hypothetical protein
VLVARVLAGKRSGLAYAGFEAALTFAHVPQRDGRFGGLAKIERS